MNIKYKGLINNFTVIAAKLQTVYNQIKLQVRGNYFKNVGILVSGTAIAQIVTVAMVPVLTRLYDPYAFGILGLFVSFVAMIKPVSSLRYDISIVLPKKKDDAVNLLALSVIIIFSISSIVLFIVAIFGKNIATIYNTPELQLWLWFVPLAIFAGGLYNSMDSWSTRGKLFKQLSVSRIITSTSTVSAKTTGGYFGLGVAGLIGGQIVGQIIANIVLGVQIFRKDLKGFFSKMSLTGMITNSQKYSDFPKFNVPKTMLGHLSKNAPVLLLGYYFTPAIVGFYTIARRLLYLPVDMVGVSIDKVFYQKANENYINGRSIFNIFIKTMVWIFFIGIIPVIIILFFGESIIVLILGDQWSTAGLYAQILVIHLFINLIITPVEPIIRILRLQKAFMFFHSIRLVLSIMSIVIGGYFGSDIIAISLYVIFNILYSIFKVYYVINRMKINKENL